MPLHQPSFNVIVISGNIGCGKTTIMNALHAYCLERDIEQHVHFLCESVDHWYFLDRFYEEMKNPPMEEPRPPSNAYLFQMDVINHYIYVTKLIMQLRDKWEANPDRVNMFVFVERSPYDVRDVFMEVNKSMFTAEESRSMRFILDQYLKLPVWNDARYIRVEAPIDECLQRVKDRKRTGENRIDATYLQRIEECYRRLAFRIQMNALTVSSSEKPRRIAKWIASVIDLAPRSPMPARVNSAGRTT